MTKQMFLLKKTFLSLIIPITLVGFQVEANEKPEVKIERKGPVEGLDWLAELRKQAENEPECNQDSYVEVSDEGTLVYNYSKLVYPGDDGRLVYSDIDGYGNRVPDYSYAGYKGGGVQIPLVPIKMTISPDADNKDDTKRIQDAINALANLPLDENGFRGALHLKAGEFEVSGLLKIEHSGIVLRGEGQSNNGGTIIRATHRGDVIRWTREGWNSRLFLIGKQKAKKVNDKNQIKIIDQYLPIGSDKLTLEDVSSLKVGDEIAVQPLANLKYRNAYRGHLGWWQSNEHNGKYVWQDRWNNDGLGRVRHEATRNIKAIVGNKIILDVPIYLSISQKYGGGVIFKTSLPDRIYNVGLENMKLVSVWEPEKVIGKDGKELPGLLDAQKHCAAAIEMYNTWDIWVRDITAVDFIGSGFSFREGIRRGTIQDCTHLLPPDKYYEGQGYVARYGYNVSEETLIQRCYASGTRHSFNSGAAHGPRVYFQCISEDDLGGPGPHHGWIPGDLFDNVKVYGKELQISTRGGTQWRGINSTMWNCGAKAIVNMMPPQSWPPIGYNFAIGCFALPATEEDIADHRGFYRTKGEVVLGKEARMGNGVWESWGKMVTPRSLYLKQLEDRLGYKAVANTLKRQDWIVAFGKKSRSRLDR